MNAELSERIDNFKTLTAARRARTSLLDPCAYIPTSATGTSYTVYNIHDMTIITTCVRQWTVVR